ncbi:MAG: type II toxin-antitoxin system RelE/ParE family toxin [Planctomycetes bacterium]|nr:type II toxin-antitoxin system RelE/ParE family toxin [Planctomycetota bacterium]
MRFDVVLTARAIRDLERARDYLRQAAPEAADRWYGNFLTALLRLEVNPESRSLAPESAEFPFELRQFLFRTKSRFANRALYRIVGKEVQILAIRRPGQPLFTREELD